MFIVCPIESTELEKSTRPHQQKVRKLQAKRYDTKRISRQAYTFSYAEIVTLKFPASLKMTLDNRRVYCIISECHDNGTYGLRSQFGYIEGTYRADQLNPTNGVTLDQCHLSQIVAGIFSYIFILQC